MSLLSIALASCADHPGFVAGDDDALIEAFERAEVNASRVRWDDQTADWRTFDAVILRTTWDYHERLDEFLDWCARVDQVTTLLNPLPIIRQNAVKTYLRGLDATRVPIVPTTWIESTCDDADAIIRAALDESDSDQCIIKPVIGAAAMGLLHVTRANLDEAESHAIEWLSHSPLMVQPMLESIRTAGECSLVYVDGQFSHAIRKVPKAGDIRVQIELGGTYSIIEPTAAQLDVAQRALEAQGAGALFARVDLVDLAPNKPAIMELELIEPELFFAFVEGSGDRFVRATLRRLASRAIQSS